jgi:hypothetical protein
MIVKGWSSNCATPEIWSRLVEDGNAIHHFSICIFHEKILLLRNGRYATKFRLSTTIYKVLAHAQKDLNNPTDDELVVITRLLLMHERGIITHLLPPHDESWLQEEITATRIFLQKR